MQSILQITEKYSITIKIPPLTWLSFIFIIIKEFNNSDDIFIITHKLLSLLTNIYANGINIKWDSTVGYPFHGVLDNRSLSARYPCTWGNTQKKCNVWDKRFLRLSKIHCIALISFIQLTLKQITFPSLHRHVLHSNSHWLPSSCFIPWNSHIFLIPKTIHIIYQHFYINKWKKNYIYRY